MSTKQFLSEIDDRAEQAVLLLCSMSDALQILSLSAEQNLADITAFTPGIAFCMDHILQEVLQHVCAITQMSLTALTTS